MFCDNEIEWLLSKPDSIDVAYYCHECLIKKARDLKKALRSDV